MKKITTASGRVYFLDGEKRLFKRSGEGRMPGQWFTNGVWETYSFTNDFEAEGYLYVERKGFYLNSDLWFSTSHIASIEDVETDE